MGNCVMSKRLAIVAHFTSNPENYNPPVLLPSALNDFSIFQPNVFFLLFQFHSKQPEANRCVYSLL